MKHNSIIIIIKKILRKFNSLKLILLVLISLLAYRAVGIWSTPITLAPQTHSSSQLPEKSDIEESEESESVTIAYYEDIPMKNFFRPDRKEYSPPPSLPPSPPPVNQPPPPPPKKKLPEPKLMLNGILSIEGNKDIALISGYYFTEKSKVKIKYQKVREGEVLGQYMVKKIEEKAVILKKEGEEDLTLTLSFSSYKSSAKKASKQSLSRANQKRVRRRRKNNIKNDTINTVSGINAMPREVPPSMFDNEKSETIGGGSREEIPAVYYGGRVYYPRKGAASPPPSMQGAPPPPQNISGVMTAPFAPGGP